MRRWLVVGGIALRLHLGSPGDVLHDNAVPLAREAVGHERVVPDSNCETWGQRRGEGGGGGEGGANVATRSRPTT
jgi:hypothetical protein